MLRTIVAVLALANVHPLVAVCESEKPPQSAQRKASGMVNTQSSSSSSFDQTIWGGQAVWVEVSNANILGAGVSVTISSGGRDLCASSLVIAPKGTQYFKTGVFSDKSVDYRIVVEASEGSEVIATVEVHSIPAQK